MKLDEYKEKINEIVTNSDTAPASAAEILKEIEIDLVAKKTADDKVAELESKVTDLQNTNMKLYLNVTGAEDTAADEDEPATGLGVIDEFIDKVLKEE